MELLSEKLREVVLASEQSDAPVLHLWTGGVDLEVLKSGVVDEEAVILQVRDMLADTDRFIVEPEPVSLLRSSYQEVASRGDDYLREALGQQRSRIKTKLEQPEFASVEKEVKDLQRYLQRANEKLINLENPKAVVEKLRVYFDSIKFSYGSKIVLSIHGDQVLLELSDNLRNDKTFMQGIELRIYEPIDKAAAAVADLTRKLEVAQARLETKGKAVALLAKTESRLKELGVEDQPKSLKVMAVVASAPTSAQASIPPSGRIGSNPGVAKVKEKVLPNKSAKGAEALKDTVNPGIVEPAKVESAKKDPDIKKLEDMISVAEKGNGKIRVLTGDTSILIQRFGEAWRELLTAMNFEGSVECITYSDLAKTKDFDSPVVIPGRMNTHHTFWDKSKFINRVVIEKSTPKLLLNMVKAK